MYLTIYCILLNSKIHLKSCLKLAADWADWFNSEDSEVASNFDASSVEKRQAVQHQSLPKV